MEAAAQTLLQVDFWAALQMVSPFDEILNGAFEGI